MTMRTSTNQHRHPSNGSRIFWVMAVLLTLSAFACAQIEDTGKVSGGYIIHQAIEFGGHVGEPSGNADVYNTFVNVHPGARLFDYSLNMHSILHTGAVFDDLSFSNSGYGGDPNDMSRLRIQKNKWYDFTAQFRRDVNYYNYNDFANPLNYGPTAAVPGGATAIQWNDSIHVYNTRRKMGDFNLVLAPQSAIRVRLGWSRYDNGGPSYSSFHEGTDVQLFQNFSTRQDTYTAGVDLRLAPRTTLSYDQSFTHGKNNTWYSDTNVAQGGFFLNVGGTPRPFDPGAIYSSYYGQPCAGVAISATGVVTQSGSAPNGCQGFASYSRSEPSRLNIPTEQLSFQSNYFKKLDITASATYSSAENKIDNYVETMNYWVSRLNEVGAQYTGPTRARRIDAGADLGFTYHFNDSWSFSNQTKWQNWRTPGTWASASTACYPSISSSAATFVGPFTPANASNPACAAITGQPVAATSLITASLAADSTSQLYSRYLAQMSWNNTSLLEWNPSRRFGAHLGARFSQTNLDLGEFDSQISSVYLGAPVGARPGNGAIVLTGTDLSDAPTDKETVNEKTLLLGFKARPLDNWNITGDFDWMYADNQLTPISPRHYEQLKVRSSYRVAKWGSLNASANVRESRNSVVPMNPPDETTGVQLPAFPSSYIQPAHRDHNRSFSFGMSLTPSAKFTLDLGYTYNDVYMHSGSCLMVSGSAASPLIPQGGNILRCSNVTDPYFNTNTAGQAIPAILDYAQTTNTGYFNLMFKPAKRVTMTMGYDVTADGGKNDWLRADTGALLMFPVDQVGNVIITSTGGVPTPAAGSGQVLAGYAPGPNPYQPVGTLGMNWIKPSAGVEIELAKGWTFRGLYNYYSYKEQNGVSRFNILAPTNFHANIETLSLRYAF
jgi:hypothetical protein